MIFHYLMLVVHYIMMILYYVLCITMHYTVTFHYTVQEQIQKIFKWKGGEKVGGVDKTDGERLVSIHACTGYSDIHT